MTYHAKNWKLSQGLKVIYEKNNSANVVSLQIGIKVGSRNEKPDESGICHLIEHMVFKGTKSYKVGEIASLVEASGGELNAYTSLDQTVYYINLPSKKLATGLNILKEMVFDAKFDAIELEREKEVVVEEIKRGLDNPQRVLGQKAFSTFYHSHPYKRPVIGTAELVRGFSRNKVNDFYKKYYSPNNMVLAVCGNVSEKVVKHQIQKIFKNLSAKKILSESHIKKDSLQRSFKISTVQMDYPATLFDLCFPVPELSHNDTPILDMLSYLLGESDTSLLEQNVKEEKQLVHSIYSSCFTPKDPGMFFIGGHLDPQNINSALIAIKKEVQWAQNNLFEYEKIERAKNLMKSQIIYDKQTCQGTARKWMTYETTLNDYNFEEKYLKQIDKMTAEDIQRVAKKYLKLDQCHIVILHPPKAQIKIDKSIFKKEKSQTKTHTLFQILSKSNETQVYQLPNKIRVVLKENHRLPLISTKVTTLGGLRYESQKNNGIHYLMTNLLTKGTSQLNQVEIAKQCEEFCGSLSSYAGRNSWGSSLVCLSDKWQQAFSLLSHVIKQPLFAPAEIKKEKNLQYEAIKNLKDNPSQIAFSNAMEVLFKNHPYEKRTIGTKETIKNLKQKDLKAFYEKAFSPDQTVIAIVGDFDSKQILEKIHADFDCLKIQKQSQNKITSPHPLKKVEKKFQNKNKNQTHIAVCFKGPDIYNKDKYCLDVIHSLLSGQGGRLFLELRDKKSLAYTVTTSIMQGLDTGLFSAYIGTDPQKTQTAIEEIFKEIQKIQETYISSQELDRAKNYIIGNHEIDHQKNSSIAMQLSLNELYGLGLKEFYNFEKDILKITKQDILETARKYLTLDKCVISVVGPKGCFKI